MSRHDAAYRPAITDDMAEVLREAVNGVPTMPPVWVPPVDRISHLALNSPLLLEAWRVAVMEARNEYVAEQTENAKKETARLREVIAEIESIWPEASA